MRIQQNHIKHNMFWPHQVIQNATLLKWNEYNSIKEIINYDWRGLLQKTRRTLYLEMALCVIEKCTNLISSLRQEVDKRSWGAFCEKQVFRVQMFSGTLAFYIFFWKKLGKVIIALL